MIIIQEKIINEEVVDSFFACNLDACKGACCWEGDYGAPLEISEVDEINKNLANIKEYLNEESIELIEKEGFDSYYKDINTLGTQLKPNGDCVFLKRESNGVAYCGIEKAYYDGKSDFIKPVSCHLYPIRIDKDPYTGFEVLFYQKWSICNPACSNGKKLGIPLFQFVKNGLIRKYGSDFFEELEAYHEHFKNKTSD